jgi:protocatechuate 3,4-dioxygenase beta subunit
MRVKVHGKAPARLDVRCWLAGGMLLLIGFGMPAGYAAGASAPSAAGRCPLTPGDGGDPFYKPNTPVRPHVGTGFVLTGIVRSGIDCSALKGARVEFWLRGPNGQYDDVHRGTVITDGDGRYRFESSFPGGGDILQPHIHLRVAVPGFRTLTTVYLPRAGAAAGALDLVLEPEL